MGTVFKSKKVKTTAVAKPIASGEDPFIHKITEHIKDPETRQKLRNKLNVKLAERMSKCQLLANK